MLATVRKPLSLWLVLGGSLAAAPLPTWSGALDQPSRVIVRTVDDAGPNEIVGARAEGDEPPTPEVERADQAAVAEALEVDDSPAVKPSGDLGTTLSAAAQDGDAARRTERIVERYASGATRVERTVTQDAQGNYLNHGPWTLYDEEGAIRAQGDFAQGKPVGVWKRVFQPGEGEIFKGPLYQRFTAPFHAQANFAEGRLDGVWTISDADDRVVSAWTFHDGMRDGDCHWWFPNGQTWRESHFARGQLSGRVAEWDEAGELLKEEFFEAGRKRATRTTWHAPGQKHIEAEMLLAPESITYQVDFFAGVARNEVHGRHGADERHGNWTAWHANGQKQLAGRYEHDSPAGIWTWWHENGQMATQGQYADGRQAGEWTWWHENGQKSIVGHYDSGQQAGEWTWWTAEGKVKDRGTFVARAPVSPRAAAPHSGLPAPRRPVRQVLIPRGMRR